MINTDLHQIIKGGSSVKIYGENKKFGFFDRLETKKKQQNSFLKEHDWRQQFMKKLLLSIFLEYNFPF